MAKKIQVGIIGTGIHGSRYANHITNDVTDTLVLSAISRRSQEGEKQASTWNCRYYKDWRELVQAKSVEAVIAVTTPNLNPQIGELCIREQKPLLLEKPLTTDYPSALRLVEAFEKKSLPLTIAQTLRFNSVINTLKQELPGMGDILAINACQRLEPSSHPWLKDPAVAGGGVIFHTAVHLFDALRHITGQEITSIRASSRRIYNPKLEDLVTAEIRCSKGAMGVVDVAKVSPARMGKLEFICEKGHLQGDQIHSTVQKIYGSQIENVQCPPPAPTIPPLLRDWHAYLCGKGINPVPGLEGLAAVKICHACRLATETGDWVSLSDF